MRIEKSEGGSGAREERREINDKNVFKKNKKIEMQRG